MSTPFLSDYLKAAADSSDRPVLPTDDPGTSPEMIAFRFEADTQTLVFWDPVNEEYLTVSLGGVTVAASDVSYDNITSGLTAINVQAAIDELASIGAPASTTDLPEGTNLYFTNERAQDAVGTALNNANDVKFDYDDVGNVITASATRVLSILVFDDDEEVVVGDGARRLRINALLNGWNIVAVASCVTSAPSGGPVTVQLFNDTTNQDILSTELTIDSGELDSKDATTPVVIDGAQDAVATGNQIRIDIDAGNGAFGLIVDITIERP